jgi:hypothetical protein
LTASQAELLARRREQLVVRCEDQRAVLAEHAARLRAQVSIEALLGAALCSARGRSLGLKLIGAALFGWKCWRLFRALRSR